jgi:SAM-dependent methyltransferase
MEESLKRAIKRMPLLVSLLVSARNGLRFIPQSLKYLSDLIRFRLRLGGGRFAWHWRSLYPCLGDDTAATGFDRHYTFHTAWAARAVAAIRPEVHHDVSSAIYFSTITSAFVPVRFYDYRPAKLDLSNLTCGRADLAKLPFESDSLQSLSCMHVVEHIGLGRYGDALDPDGDLKAMNELKRVVKPGGNLLFVVPVGGQARILFNAHRIYTVEMIRAYFEDRFTLRDWSLIPENPADGDLVPNANEALREKQFYGCGCFWFVKKDKA